MNTKSPSHFLLHTFCTRPDSRFETQHDDEEIALMVRAHPITQIFWIVNTLFLALLIILLNFILNQFLTPSQLTFFNCFSLVIIFSYVWFNFLGWFFNVGIVTNQRIIDIDFSGIIYKEVTETTLEKVEDVTAKSGGFLASLFNFGNIFIQTAGTEVNIEFIDVPKPAEVTKIINQMTKHH